MMRWKTGKAMNESAGNGTRRSFNPIEWSRPALTSTRSRTCNLQDEARLQPSGHRNQTPQSAISENIAFATPLIYVSCQKSDEFPPDVPPNKSTLTRLDDRRSLGIHHEKMSAEKHSQRRISIVKRSPNAAFLGHLPDQDAPEAIFKRLSDDFREYLKPNPFDPSSIEMKLPFGHPDLDRLLVSARELGLAIPKDGSEHSMGVRISDFIVYSDSEIEAARFVECERFAPFIASPSEINFGPVERIASDRYIKQSKNRTFGSLVNLYHLLAVRGKAIAILRAANLKGLLLIPMVPDNGWPQGIEPLSLVWSEETFPPLDEESFVERLGITIQGRRKVEKVRVDGYRVHPRLRYVTREVPDVDVAITNEQFGKTPHYHGLIFSRKARRALESVDKELSFTPVITDTLQDRRGNLPHTPSDNHP